MNRRAVALATLLALALGTAGAGSAAAAPSRQDPRETGPSAPGVEPAVTIDVPADLSVQPVGGVVVLEARVRGALRCTVAWGDGATAVADAADGLCRAGHRYLTRGAHDVTVTASSPAGSAGDTVALLLADPEATVVGTGSVAGTSFGLAAASASFGPVGDVGIRTGDGHLFHGTPLAVVVTGRTSTWWGAGRFDAIGRCGFLVTVVDAGPRGDRARLVVTSPAGTTLVDAAGPLTRGGVDVRPR